MITEAIFNLLFGVSETVLGLLPPIEWTVDTSAWTYVTDILSMIAYLLPWGHIVAIASLLIAIAFLRLFISLALTLKGFIPGLG